MQSDNTSKKPRKTVKENPLAVADSPTTETPKKARSAKSSPSKSSVPRKSNASPKHHHSAVTEKVSSTPVKRVPAKEIATEPLVIVATLEKVEHSYEDVAKLAHSFWVARQYEHGFADEDWLRAEHELKLAR